MEMGEKSKVAVVTGANAGVGFKVCEKLLKRHPTMKLCLACRNRGRGEQAAFKLRTLFPKANISLIILDTSSVESVFTAAEQLRRLFDHIDYLYLNAGMMKIVGFDWLRFGKGLMSTKAFEMFATGEGLLIHEDGVTNDGLQQVFSTNVFGHYILLKELEICLENGHGGQGQHPTQVIWTSSSNAAKRNFSLDNIQHRNGKEPYSSSKYAIDTIALGLNERLNKKDIYVHTICPGLVHTNMTNGILPAWFWTIMIPFIFLLRLFVPSMTFTADFGAEALLWVTCQDPASIGPNVKLQSNCGISGKPFVKKEKLAMSLEESEQLLLQLDALEDEFRRKHNKLKRKGSSPISAL